jgi:hypothetical protein
MELLKSKYRAEQDCGQWQKACLENVNDCYKTRHNRPTVKRELLVYHLLLDFVK